MQNTPIAFDSLSSACTKNVTIPCYAIAMISCRMYDSELVICAMWYSTGC